MSTAVHPDSHTTTGARSSRNVSTLVRDLRDQLIRLFKQEMQLVQVEASEKASQAMMNVAKIAAGALVIYAGAILIFAALSIGAAQLLVMAGLGQQVSYLLGFLIVGGIVALIGALYVRSAIKVFQSGELVPNKTIETLKEEKEWVEEKLK